MTISYFSAQRLMRAVKFPQLAPTHLYPNEWLYYLLGKDSECQAHGWSKIGKAKSADAPLVTPLMIIFTNCLRQGVFPEI